MAIPCSTLSCFAFLLISLLSYFIKLHDVKHLEYYITDCRVPTLMKVSIAPMAYRMIVVKQMFMDVIHCLTLLFNICHKVAFIIRSPGH